MTERLIGYDYLGAIHPKFRVKGAVNFTPRGAPLRNLDNTFGTDLTRIRRLINGLLPDFYGVHIWNTTCLRSRSCGVYEPFRNYTVSTFDQAIKARNRELLSRFEKRVEAYRSLAHDFEGTTFFVSPALEHNLSKKSWNILADAALSVWPGVLLVNNPAGGIEPWSYRGSWTETHTDPKNIYKASDTDIVSSDGVDIEDIKDLKRWFHATRSAHITYVHSHLYNGRNERPPQPDPRKRTNWPTGSDFKRIVDKVNDAT